MTDRIGLIAGNGQFPLIFAEHARQVGFSVIAVAHAGETEPALSDLVDQIIWIHPGEMEKLISFFREEGISEAVMAGGIQKTRLFEMRPDQRASRLLSSLPEKKDDALLRAFARELTQEGIDIKDATPYLSDLLADEGEMTRPLTTTEREDVRWGWRLAKQVGALDIGQCVVVKEGVILAVEAIEGTDAAIKRGGMLGKGGAVVVKVLKPQQDVRFDLPTVGPGTIHAMGEVSASVLAVEAGCTLLIEKKRCLAEARDLDIAVIGYADRYTEKE